MPDDWPTPGDLGPRLQALPGIARADVAQVVDSTNLVVTRILGAKSPGLVAGDGIVAVAARQTAGRGRRGRAWADVEGGNVAISIALPVPPAGASLVPLAAAMALREVLGALGAATSLKWPNDVRVVVAGSPRKVAGILVEVQPTPHGQVAVIGVGVDVDWRGVDRTTVASRLDGDGPCARPSEPPAGATPADAATWSSVAEAIDGDVDRNDLVTRVVASVVAWHERVASHPEGVRDAYAVACATLGQSVRVDLGTRILTGVATGLDAHGALQVATPGDVVTVAAGDVVHLREVAAPPP